MTSDTDAPRHDVPTMDDILSRSGLDFMRDILSGALPSTPIAATLGFALTDVQDGRVTFEGEPDHSVTNVMGGVHGGWYGTLLDSALGCAVMTRVPRGSYYTTLEYKVNLTRAIPLGMTMTCTADVTHAGRTTAVATAEIRGTDDGKLYATGSTTCLIMTAPAST